MKKTIRKLLAERPDATVNTLSAECIKMVVKAIVTQTAGLGVDTEVFKVNAFMHGWITVEQAVGFIASQW